MFAIVNLFVDNVYIDLEIFEGVLVAYHHGDLRNALIKAAIPLLSDKGISGLSLREVAREVGVGHAAPYRHFKNKHELLQAIAVHGFHKLTKSCALAEKKFPDDPVNQFADGGIRYLLFVYENPVIANLMFGGYFSSQSCSEEMLIAANEAMSVMINAIKCGQDAGLYKETGIEEMTLAAWSTIHGLSMLVVSGALSESASSRAKVKKLGETVGNILLQGILK